MLKRVSISDANDVTDERLDLAVPGGDCTRPDEFKARGVGPSLIEDGLICACELGVRGLKEGLALYALAGSNGGPMTPGGGPPLDESVR